MLKFLRQISIALVLTSVLSLLSTWYLLAHPEALVAVARPWVLPKDAAITWKSFSLDRKNSRFGNWLYSLKIEGLEYTDKRLGSHYVFSDFALRASLRIEQMRLIATLHELAATGSGPQKQNWKSVLFSSASVKQKPHFHIYRRLNTYIGPTEFLRKFLRIEKIAIRVPEIQLNGGSADLTIEKSNANSEELQIRFVQSDRFDFAATVFLGRWDTSHPLIHLIGKALGGREASLRADIFKNGSGFQGHYEGRITVDSWGPRFGKRLDFKLDSQLNPEVWRLTGQLIPIVEANTQFLNQPVQVDVTASQNHREPSPGHLALETAINLSQVKTFFADCDCFISPNSKFALSINFWNSNTNSGGIDFTGKITGDELRNQLFVLTPALDVKGTLSGEGLAFQPAWATVWQWPSFQGLLKYLKRLKVDLANGIERLDGPINLNFTGAVDRSAMTSARIFLPLNFVASLKAGTESLTMRSQGHVDLAGSRVSIVLQNTIDESQLQLGTMQGLFGYGVAPQTISSAPVSGGPTITVEMDFATDKPGGFVWLTPLAKPNLPMNLQMRKNGFVEVLPFQLQNPRRVMSVERLKMDVTENSDGGFPIVGQLRVNQTNYKILIDIGGTTVASHIQVSSEPFLARQDIVSVLLFDRLASRLTEEEKDHLERIDEALLQRAIGVFGMAAIAASPLKSFDFDPKTHHYTASLQAIDGSPLAIGTKWESALHSEVRKRFSRSWILVGSWRATPGGSVLTWEWRRKSTEANQTLDQKQ